MTTDALRTRAREAAAEAHPEPWPGMVPMAQFSYAEGYAAGYLAHAAQQPTRDDISDAIEHSGIAIGTTDAEMAADAVLALLDGAGS